MDFFTSDPHFGHKNIMRPDYCNRPWTTVEEMDEALIQRWNEVVGPDDHVFVLGDVSFHKPARTKEIIARLNGTKYLVKGNHDRGEEAMKAMGFEWVSPHVLYTVQGLFQLIHNPDDATVTSGHVLCGHVHNFWRTKQIGDVRYTNVGVDVWDYRPVTLGQLLQAPNMLEPEGGNRHVGDAYL